MLSDIKAIAEHNGPVLIKDKLVEEIHELLAAIEQNDEDNIVEEIADVIIMCKQYVHSKGAETQFHVTTLSKIARTKKRLGLF